MAGEYEKAISIKEAIDAINSNDYLLPAIQRKFVWSSDQICVLFDSIMQGYPINTFMMWDVKDGSIKNDHKFYEFLKSYCQRFEEENPYIYTGGFKDFKAIIDGQQRLTSLYIGLCGTYAYKNPRIWWPSAKNDDDLPPRKLYLDLQQPMEPENDESLMKYNFRFLTEEQYQDSKKGQSKNHWFCLHEILQLPHHENTDDILLEVVIPELEKRELSGNSFARKTLLKLYDVIRSKKIIHYFNESEQKIDHVLDIFIRTNNGGTKLDFSDLLMSIAVSHWDGDFRKELDDLIKYIHQNVEMGFYLERDWILKTCLMLIGADVKFKVKNFGQEQVRKIQNEWQGIKECIKATFLLIRRFGINPQSLTSKNAVIPICYYLYKKRNNGQALYLEINNLAKNHQYRASISQWFYMALLKGIFGGQADSILVSMRSVLDENISQPDFPLQKIIEHYDGKAKDLCFNESYINRLLDTQYGEGSCRALLHLLFPEKSPTEFFHIDHLHPKKLFAEKELISEDFLKNDKELFEFYSNPNHWNAIPNLQLLNHSENLTKSDNLLKEWIENPDVHLTAKDLLVEDIDLDFKEFKAFYEQRRATLKNRLISRVFMSSSANVASSENDSDEEIKEDMV